jgi:hypothetical protein
MDPRLGALTERRPFRGRRVPTRSLPRSLRGAAGVLLAGCFPLAGLLASPAAALAACPAPNGDAYSAAVLADSPVAYYRLDEASGSTMCDSSPSANNGTYSARGITYGAAGPLASGDTAIAADGTAGVVGQSGANSPITGNHSFTLEAWFKNTETTPSNHVLVDIGQSCTSEVSGQSCTGVTITNGQVAGLAMYPNQNAQLGWGPTSGFGIDEQGSNYVWDPTTVGINLWDGNWHYLAVSYDATADQLTGYVDGHDLSGPDRDPYGNATFNIAAAPVALGQWFSSGYFAPLVGGLDEAAVYPAALSSARITAHFQAAIVPLGSSGPPTPAPTVPPQSTAAPAISGTAQQGQTLFTTAGGWSNSPTSFTYQWVDCNASGGGCSNIAGATHNTYTLAPGDVGDTIRVVVTATNAGGSTSASSNQTAAVLPPSPPPLSSPSSRFNVTGGGGVKLPSGYRGLPVQTQGACALSLNEAPTFTGAADAAARHRKRRGKREGLIKPFKLVVAGAGLHVLALVPTRKEIKLWRQHHKRRHGAHGASVSTDPVQVRCQPINFSVVPATPPAPILDNGAAINSAPPPGFTVHLGGLDADGFCRSLGFSRSQLNGSVVAPDATLHWVCVGSAGQQAPFDLEGACRWQYPGFDVVYVADINNAYSGQCWAIGTPVGSAITTTINVSPPPPPGKPLSGCWSGSNAVGSISLCVSGNKVTSLRATAGHTSTSGLCTASASIPQAIPLSTSGGFSFAFPTVSGGFSGEGQVTASGGQAGVGIASCTASGFWALKP